MSAAFLPYAFLHDINRSSLSAPLRNVLRTITSLASPGRGSVCVTLGRLASFVGTCTRGVRRQLRALEKAKWLTTERRTGRASTYTLRAPVEVQAALPGTEHPDPPGESGEGTPELSAPQYREESEETEPTAPTCPREAFVDCAPTSRPAEKRAAIRPTEEAGAVRSAFKEAGQPITNNQARELFEAVDQVHPSPLAYIGRRILELSRRHFRAPMMLKFIREDAAQDRQRNDGGTKRVLTRGEDEQAGAAYQYSAADKAEMRQLALELGIETPAACF